MATNGGGQYAPLPDVEAGGTMVENADEGAEGGDGEYKSVALLKPKPGVPLPVFPVVEKRLMRSWALGVVAMVILAIVIPFLLLSYRWWYYLPDYPFDVKLDLENCDVEFHAAKGSPYVMVSWFPMLADKEETYHNFIGTFKASLKMKKLIPWLGCHVAFYLDPKKEVQFRKVIINSGGVGYTSIYSTLPIVVTESVEIQAKYSNIMLRYLHAQKINIAVNDGMVELEFQKSAPKELPQPPPLLSIESKRAPVTLRTTRYVVLNLFGGTDYIAASGVSVMRGYCAENSMSCSWAAPITLREKLKNQPDSKWHIESGGPSDVASQQVVDITASEAATYILADAKFGALQTWRGDKQITPHFMEHSVKLLDKIEDWKREEAKAPWAVYIQVLGPGMPRGTWRFLSTSAYLAFSSEWYIMYSAAMLKPRMLKYEVHMSGIEEIWPPRYKSLKKDTPEGADLRATSRLLTQEKDLLLPPDGNVSLAEDHELDKASVAPFAADEFQVLAEEEKKEDEAEEEGEEEKEKKKKLTHEEKVLAIVAAELFTKLNVTFFTPVVWAPTSSPKRYMYHDIHHEIVSSQVHFFDQFPFILSAILNGLAGTMVALVIVGICYTVIRPFLLSTIREASVSLVATHRRTNSSKCKPSWRIVATIVEWERHGVLLRWAKRPKQKEMKTLLLYNTAINPYAANKKTRPDELLLFKINVADVKPNKINPDELNLLISAKITKQTASANEPMHLPLELGFRHRFRIEAKNRAGTIVEKSASSDVVLLRPNRCLTDYPFILIKTFFPAAVSSFELFLRNYTDSLSAALAVKLSAGKLYMTDEMPGEDKIAEEPEGVSWVLNTWLGEERVRAETETNDGEERAFLSTEKFIVANADETKYGKLDSTVVKENTLSGSEGAESNFPKLYEPAEAKAYKARFELCPSSAALRVVNVAVLNYFSREEQVTGKVEWEHVLAAQDDKNRRFLIPLQNKDEDHCGDIGFTAEFVNYDFEARKSNKVWNSKTGAYETKDLLQRQNDSIFIGDVPGLPFRQGTERFIRWQPWPKGAEKCKPADLVDFYVEQSDSPGEIRVLSNVMFGSQSTTWVCDGDFNGGRPWIACRLHVKEALETHKEASSSGKTPEMPPSLATSNWFQVLRTLTVTEFELAYGAYCRMNGVPMERLDENTLESVGKLELSTLSLRYCEGIRAPLPFELEELSKDPKERDGSGMAECEGALCVANKAIKSSTKAHAEEKKGDPTSLFAAAAAPAVPAPTKTFRLVSKKTLCIENRVLLQEKPWKPAWLLENGLEWSLVVEMAIMGFFSMVPDGVKKSVPKNWAKRIYTFLFLELVPQLLEVFFYLIQILSFMVFPLGIAAFVCLRDYTHWEMNPSWSKHEEHDVMYSDFLFDPSPMFLIHMPVGTQLTLWFITIFAGVQLASMFYCNFLRSDLPSFDGLIQSISTLSNVLAALVCIVFVSTTMLWFVLGALINPKALMPYAVMVLAASGMVKAMWAQLNDLKDQVMRIIEEQLDFLLGIILDLFIDLVGIPMDDAGQSDEEELKIKTMLNKTFFAEMEKEMKASGKSTPAFSTSTGGGGGGGGGGKGPEVEGMPDSPNAKRLAKIYFYVLENMALDKQLKECLDDPNTLVKKVMNVRLTLLRSLGVLKEKGKPNEGGTSKALRYFFQMLREQQGRLPVYTAQCAQEKVDPKELSEDIKNFYDTNLGDMITAKVRSLINENVSDSYTAELLGRAEDYAKNQTDGAENLDSFGRFLEREKVYTEDMLKEPGVRESLKVAVEKAVAPDEFKETDDFLPFKVVDAIRHLVKDKIWVSAFHQLLKVCGFTDEEMPRSGDIDYFKSFCDDDSPYLMSKDSVIDCIMKITNGGLWFAATIALLRKVKCCGNLGCLRLGEDDDENNRMVDDWRAYIKDREGFKFLPPPAFDKEYNRLATKPPGYERGFLQKAAALEFIQCMIFDDEKSIKGKPSDETCPEVKGMRGWRFDKNKGVLYWEKKRDHWVQMRGIWEELWESLLRKVGMKFSPEMARFFFSMASDIVPRQGGRINAEFHVNPQGQDLKIPTFISMGFFWEMCIEIVSHLKFVSLDGFVVFLQNCKITVPTKIVKEVFEHCPEAEFVKPCHGLVEFAQLEPSIPSMCSRGLWKEGVMMLVQDNLNIPISDEELEEIFNELDVTGNGFLDPAECYDLIKKLGRRGMTFNGFKQLLISMKLKVKDAEAKQAFAMMDPNQDGILSCVEFVSGLGYIITTLIPKTLMDQFGLTIQKIVPAVLGALIILLTIFVFILLAMATFTVASGIGSIIQSTLAIGSAGGVKEGKGGESLDKLKVMVMDLIDDVMQISKSQRNNAKQ